jgi:ubiquinone/menaquinone biosynthesis C-methylase UbiE
MAQDNTAGINWSQSAPYWEKYRDIIRTMFAPISDALIADAKIRRGYKVLDVGTGPGEPALSVAKVVGEEGKVYGIDPAPEMIAAARRAAAREGFKNVEFEVAPADKLSFAPDGFDAVVSRFAVMFFPAPLDAIREILRVLKPDGFATFAVWSFYERNPFHYELSQVVERYPASSPLPMPPLESSNAFLFAPPGKLRAILDQAGASETSERLFQFRIEAPLSSEDFWTLRAEMSERLRSKLATLSADQAAEARSQALSALRPYSTTTGISLPAEVLIVRGKKPSPSGRG